MSMQQISIEKTKMIAKHYGLFPIRIKGTSQINIAKTMNEKKYEILSWEEFEKILNEKGLYVAMAYDSHFLKIMKKKTTP